MPDAWLEVSPLVAKGLDDLAVGDDIIVLTWLHLARRDVLKVHPRSDRTKPLNGVFATRSPDRPNPLGLHPVTVREVKKNRLRIGSIEVIDGTPVVDVKAVHCAHNTPDLLEQFRPSDVARLSGLCHISHQEIEGSLIVRGELPASSHQHAKREDRLSRARVATLSLVRPRVSSVPHGQDRQTKVVDKITMKASARAGKKGIEKAVIWDARMKATGEEARMATRLGALFSTRGCCGPVDIVKTLSGRRRKT